MQINPAMQAFAATPYPSRAISYASPIAPVSAPSWAGDRLAVRYAQTKPQPSPDDLPPPSEPIPFSKGELGTMLRVGGMLAGSTAIGGTAGYLAGRAFGFSTSVGAAVGAGLGFAVPIGLVAYSLYKWGQNN